MLIKQAHQKSLMFVAIDFLNYIFKFQPNVSNRYHDLVMSVNLSDMSILLFQTLKVLIIIVLLV